MPHLSVYTVCVLIFLSIVQHELLSEFCYACSVCGYIRMCICMYICNLQKNRNTLMAGEVWWLFSTMAWHTSFPRSHCSIGIVWLVRMNPNLYIAYIHLWNAWWVLWCMLCGFVWVHTCAFLISRQIDIWLTGYCYLWLEAIIVCNLVSMYMYMGLVNRFVHGMFMYFDWGMWPTISIGSMVFFSCWMHQNRYHVYTCITDMAVEVQYAVSDVNSV